MNQDTDIQSFWNAYMVTAAQAPASYRVFRFGDTDELADKLLDLVLTEKKRATTSLLRDFTHPDRPMPRVEEFGVVVDAQNKPRCIIRTTEVAVKKICDVDEEFARDDGGGDCSLAWWRSSHERYFKRRGAREDFVVDDNTEVVLVRFELVYPRKVTQAASWV